VDVADARADPPAPDRPDRNVAVDLARALAIVVVVWFHLSFFRLDLRFTPEGEPQLGFGMRSLGVVGWVGSWFLQIMPLFFVAGGFANTLVVDRHVRSGASLGHYLALRGRRLIGPLTVYIGWWTLVGTIVAVFAGPETGAWFSGLLTRVLWFIVVYLLIVLIAPVMVRAQDRWGWRVPVVLLAAALVVDTASFLAHNPWIREINLLTVWPFAHQLGIAYARGRWRTSPRWVSLVTAGAAAAAILVLLLIAPYPTTAVGLGDQAESNLAPPSAPMALLALVQVAGLALLERYAGAALAADLRLRRVLGVVNALAMTLYLWHLPIIGLTAVLLMVPSLVLGHAVGFLLATPVYWLVGVPLLVALVPLIGRLEYALIPPMGERQDTRLAVVGTLVLIVGLEIIQRTGMVVHPGAPMPTVGVGLFAIGALALARASNMPERRRGLPGGRGAGAQARRIHRV